MANGEKNGEESSTRGSDWEVVSLTASAYAAYPGPNKSEDGGVVDQGEPRDVQQEHLSTMFMSQHFVIPPAQHENLPLASAETLFTTEAKNVSEINLKLQPEVLHSSQICEDPVEVDPTAVHKADRREGETVDTALEEWNFNDMQRSIKDFADSKSLHEIPFLYEKGKNLPPPGKSFEEVDTVQGLKWMEPIHLSGKTIEQSIYESAKLGSFYAEADKSGLTTFKETSLIEDELLKGEFQAEDSSSELNYSSDSEKRSMIVKEGDSGGPDLPDQAWWKRQTASLYAQVREANALWPVFVAAAVMGLAILGHRWQQEKLHIWQQKWQLSISDEKLSRMLAPVSRFRDALVGQRRPPVLHYSNSLEL